MDIMEKDELFEKVNPFKALLIMAAPTVASQLVILFYNIADTWFIGRTNNPYMIAASNLGLTVYLVIVALSNIFGVGGGSLMVRLTGEKKTEEACKVASYSVALSAIVALVSSILVLVGMGPMLRALGAGENTFEYARQYVFFTVVLGALPTVLSMSMPQLIRNAGYSKEAGLGVTIGSLINVALDPLFMFVILPEGKEVMGAAIATMLSNVISLVYFIVVFGKLRDKTVLRLPKRIEKLEGTSLRSLYFVGIPAAISILLFDVVNIALNRLSAGYGDIPLAAVGIVLKLERIPINVGLGICLGMVPLVAYNFGSGNHKRMKSFLIIAATTAIAFSVISAVIFFIFSPELVGAFIEDSETVDIGTEFLKGRCFALPFMIVGYVVVNYMNAVNKGIISFCLALLRHLILILPIMLIMNSALGMTGLIQSQFVADVINAVIATVVLVIVNKKIMK